MDESLFRQEVIVGRRRVHGEVIVMAPLGAWAGALLFSFFMVVLGLVLAFGTFTRRERVTGYLSPEGGIAKIYAPRSGVVTASPLPKACSSPREIYSSRLKVNGIRPLLPETPAKMR